MEDKIKKDGLVTFAVYFLRLLQRCQFTFSSAWMAELWPEFAQVLTNAFEGPTIIVSRLLLLSSETMQ